MNASVGDHLSSARTRGDRGDDLHGEIVEILGDAGAPPYVVRSPDGHESLFTASRERGRRPRLRADSIRCLTASVTLTSLAGPYGSWPGAAHGPSTSQSL